MSEGHNQGPLSRQELAAESARLYRRMMRHYALVWRAYQRTGHLYERRAQDSLSAAIRLRDRAAEFQQIANQ